MSSAVFHKLKLEQRQFMPSEVLHKLKREERQFMSSEAFNKKLWNNLSHRSADQWSSQSKKKE